MLKYIEGDIFNSPAQVLVNTVNTVGVMGKGIALSFKKLYPDMFTAYRKECDKHRLVIGKLMLWYGPDHWVLMFPTKEHWRNPSKIEYIEKGLMAFTRRYADYNITSVAFPRLGCGNGELDWKEVKPVMEKYLKDLPIDVYIYLGPMKEVTPEHKLPKEMGTWLREHAKDMSFTGVLDDIVVSSMMIPIEIIFEGKKWTAHYDQKKKKLIFQCENNSEIVLEEGEFQKIWDKIQDDGIFPCSDRVEENLVYTLLETKGYLTVVKVQDEDSDEMKEGYQLDAGKGRYFLVKG